MNGSYGIIVVTATLLASVFSSMSFAGSASASQANNTSTYATDRMAGNSTTAASSNGTVLSGVIASVQTDDSLQPTWITAGHWKLSADGPIIATTQGNNESSDVQVTNFSASIYMVSYANGTSLHVHDVSNFTQLAIYHQGPNSTTVNGTFTVSLQEGPVNDVNGYINIVNDKVELWFDPSDIGNHFGPTSIAGIVMPSKDAGMKPGHEMNGTSSWQ